MNCLTVDCTLPRSGRSKYCREHKAIARQNWLDMVADQKQARDDREKKFADLFSQADQAGNDAAADCTPEPMTIIQRKDPLDDSSPIVKRYAPIAAGVCGFAWITIRPGNCSAAHFAKKHLGASKAYYGGLQLSVSQFGQSYELKQAYATAYATVLAQTGINASAGGRLD